MSHLTVVAVIVRHNSVYRKALEEARNINDVLNELVVIGSDLVDSVLDLLYMGKVVVGAELDLEVIESHLRSERAVVGIAHISSLIEDGIVRGRKSLRNGLSRLLAEEVEAVELTVKVHIRVADIRSVCIEVIHRVIAEHVAHTRRVGVEIVDAELSQTLVVLVFFVLVELEAEAVLILARLIYEHIRAVALCSDADIFKSYIYKRLDDTGKRTFIDKWKALEVDAAKVDENIQSLFYYHMFYLRAKEGDEKTTTPGVRKYYLEKNKNRLTVDVIEDLSESLHLWEVVNGRDAIENESWSQNMEIRKVLDCLSSYPNEFWKYPVSIFYMQYKQQDDFEDIFLKFIRKLYVLLLTRYLEKPTISAVKGDILKLNVQIINSCHPVFNAGFEIRSTEDEYEAQAEKLRTDNLLIVSHKKVERMLLKLLAYSVDGQEGLLPSYWEIEHIFPQTWDSRYYNLNKEEANAKLEHLGNKLPLEKKLNISASNNYFDKKKEKYRESKIAICSKLGNSSLPEWNLDSIVENDKKVCEKIKGYFQTWLNDYEAVDSTSENVPIPTEEELEMMRRLRERGLI